MNAASKFTPVCFVCDGTGCVGQVFDRDERCPVCMGQGRAPASFGALLIMRNRGDVVAADVVRRMTCGDVTPPNSDALANEYRAALAKVQS